MKSAGKARSNGLYRHIRTSKEIIRNLLNDFSKAYIVHRLYILMMREKTIKQEETTICPLQGILSKHSLQSSTLL